MKQKICYNKHELMNLIPGFHIISVNFGENDEDTGHLKKGFFFTNRNDISFIERYYSLWTSQNVHFLDGSVLNFKSANVNVDDNTILRINKNNIISPELNISDDFIESTTALREWLIFNGISEEQLVSISSEFTIYDEIEYLGIGTPIYYPQSNSFGISSEPLKMSELEIITVLNSIEDNLLRKKIEQILYARVFRKHNW